MTVASSAAAEELAHIAEEEVGASMAAKCPPRSKSDQ
jgi:hypothetical protein